MCGNAEEKCPRVFTEHGSAHVLAVRGAPAALTGTEEEALAQARRIRDAIAEKIRSWLLEQGIQPASLKI